MHPKLPKPLVMAGLTLLGAAPASLATTTRRTTSAPAAAHPRSAGGPTTTELSERGNPSTGSTTGTLVATVARRVGGGGARAVSPAAGTLRFLVSSLDGNDSAGTVQLVTTANGQTSCSLRFAGVYVEQEDPSAMGAPDGWRGQVSGGGDCAATELATPAGGGSAAGGGGSAAGGGGSATGGGSPTGGGSAAGAPGQPFLAGIEVTVLYTGAGPSSSSPLSVPFVGTATTATVIRRAGAGAACPAPACLLVDASSPDYVGEVIAGSLQVRAGGGGRCPGSVLYDGALPGVAALSPVTVTVPAGCTDVTARYLPPVSPTPGEGGEPITYRASSATRRVAGGTSLELAAAATYRYHPPAP